MNKKSRFDTYLAAFQKLSVFIMLPGLLNIVAISFFISGGGDFAFLQFGFARSLIRFLEGSNLHIALIAVSLAFVIGETALTFLSAKGKRWPLPLFLIIYIVDLVLACFGKSDNLASYVSNIVVHVIIAIALSIGMLFYCLAEKELKKEEKAK